MKDVKAIICDLDNTLYPYDPANKAGSEAVISFIAEKLSQDPIAVEEALLEAREIVHAMIPLHGASHSRLLYIKKALEKLTGKTHTTLSLGAENVFRETYMQNMVLYPYVKEFFSVARDKGLHIAILTNMTTQIQLQEVQRLGLEDYIDTIVTSEEIGIEKPNAKMFQAIFDQINIKKKHAIYIGDNKDTDIMGAINYGIPKDSIFHKVIDGEPQDAIAGVMQFSNYADIHKHILG